MHAILLLDSGQNADAVSSILHIHINADVEDTAGKLAFSVCM